MAILAADAFGRSVTDGWGTADTGGAYTLSGTAADFDVDGSAGTAVIGAASTARMAALTGISALNWDMTVRFALNKVPTGGVCDFIVQCRGSSATITRDGYGAQMRITTGAVVQGNFLRWAASNGAQTAITTAASAGLAAYTANAWLWARFQCTESSPTNLRLKIWYDGTDEPAAWTFVTTDSNADQQDAGIPGVRAVTGSGMTNLPYTFSYDDFTGYEIVRIPSRHPMVQLLAQ